jgi:hypothetical protein
MIFEKRDQILVGGSWVNRCTAPSPDEIAQFKRDVHAAAQQDAGIAAFIQANPELQLQERSIIFPVFWDICL